MNISVSPELALYLDEDDLKKFIEKRNGGYELIAFRKDKESALEAPTREEIIQMCANPRIADISTQKTLTDFVSTVYNAEYVYTDRLHVAILSKVLGKKVTLFGNRYHKNKGVWEYSLKDHVEFIETL